MPYRPKPRDQDKRRVDKTAEPVYKDYGDCTIENARDLLWDLAQRPNKFGQIQIQAVRTLFGDLVAREKDIEDTVQELVFRQVGNSDVPDD